MTLSTEEIIETIKKSRKYRAIHAALLEKVVAGELLAGRSAFETVKACKNKLHQVAASYFAQIPRYEEWMKQLQEASAARDERYLKDTCRHIMHAHASTRERLPILDEFYENLLSHIPVPTTILDVACGLNPLCIPWMKGSEPLRYTAIDVFEDLRDFLASVFPLLGVEGEAICADLTTYHFEQEYDLALVLKVLPPLAQQEKSAPFSLIENIKAKTLVVSFPTRSLCGKAKGMGRTYEQYFMELTEHCSGEVKKFEFNGELVFIVKRDGQCLADFLGRAPRPLQSVA